MATSALWAGAALEDRSHIRNNQEPLLSADVLAGVPCPARDGPPHFHYGCLDFLPFTDGGREGIQLLEFNGTGMGGLTNLPWPIVLDILGELATAADSLEMDAPLIVSPMSTPTNKRLLHERLLVAQALAEGLSRRHGRARIVVVRPGEEPRVEGPAVAVGWPADLRDALTPRDGRVTLGGRSVDVAVRDLFCQHLLDRYRGALGMRPFRAINAIFPICASKARTYER